jgi:hypothetical protein
MTTIAQRFIKRLDCDEFTRREIFVSLGKWNPKRLTLELVFKDGSKALNTWQKMGNNIETFTFAE